MIKLGIIGLGHMGGYHATACMSIPSLELIAIADPHEKNWEKIKSTRVLKTAHYHDWIDLVDAVIIATPTEFHHPIALDCLTRKKHVLVEKPLTKTIEQAEELFRVAQHNNLIIHIGHVERFNSAVQELKKLIHNPYLIECHRIGLFTPRPQNDSVILDLMIHDLDIILNLVNSPVSSLNMIGKKIRTSLEDIAVVSIQFQNGVLANIISSRASHIKKRTMSIHQQECFIQLDFTTQDISIHSHASDKVSIGNNQLTYQQVSTVRRLFVYKDNPLKLEIEHFIESIKTTQRPSSYHNDIIALKLALNIEQNFSL